jgi:hypothetical protein
MKQTKSIPDSVLEQIRTHRPHLGRIIDNLNTYPERAMQFERPLANAYLAGETRLSMIDTWKLSSCCVGNRFGE